jgi:hypothetical protein
MGQVIGAWGNATEQGLKTLFSGTDDAINTLTTLISDGKMIEGAVNGAAASPPVFPVQGSDAALQNTISKVFFGFSIPVIWSVSQTYAFIIDSGYSCGTVDPLGQYLTPDTMHATWACYNDKLYYLAAAVGAAEDCNDSGACSPNQFSAPPGIGSLDGKAFGGVTVSDLVTG